jgi:hypothetical protein
MNPCRRCGGLVVQHWDEVDCTRCLICGDRILADILQSPILPFRDWGIGRCLDCGEPALKRKKHCATHHGIRIKHGMNDAHGQGWSAA